MAIVTALRFTEHSGAICVDQESWHIWRRKNWFTDHIYTLLDEADAQRFGVELVYSGPGHPPFHKEVADTARKLLKKRLADMAPDDPVNVPELSKTVLEAFQAVHARRINDKLEYLFGFNVDEYNAGAFKRNGGTYKLTQKKVKDKSSKIVSGKENTGYSPLLPDVAACLIGVDRQYGYSAFALKEKDGVLSFQSCWFESLGQGKDGAALQFAQSMNDRFLDTRRTGDGVRDGIMLLLEAVSKSMNHYGQNGGFIRMIILDASGKTRKQRLIDVTDDTAGMMYEIARTARAGFIQADIAGDLIEALVYGNLTPDEAEIRLFNDVDDPGLLGKFLRGYKISEGELPLAGPEKELFMAAEVSAVRGGRE